MLVLAPEVVEEPDLECKDEGKIFLREMKLFTDFMNYHQFFRQVVDEPEDIADEPQEVVDGSDDDEIRQGAKDIPGKIGKKKMEKLEAKAEKKRMREYELQVSFFVETTEE